ncbi:LOW QUALITY PROTEIN: uncharacterized protein LOC142871533 [Microcebus murinus]|uniref:LOW QUALITY PROTEIN: uncharacterized protein LOC142871533 n=1 Tax=Microcebus murinus TaxID=30608 RepID=UPI003F6B86A9
MLWLSGALSEGSDSRSVTPGDSTTCVSVSYFFLTATVLATSRYLRAPRLPGRSWRLAGPALPGRSPHLRALIISRTAATPQPLPPLGPAAPRRFRGPRGSANCWTAAAGPSLHPLEKFLVRLSSLPPSLPLQLRLAPTSCRALGSRARAGVPGGRARSWPRPGRPGGWQWAGAAGNLGAFRERLSNSRPRRGGTWAAPRAVRVRSPRRRPLGECPSILPSLLCQCAAGEVAVPGVPLGPPPSRRSGASPLLGEDRSDRGGPEAVLAPPRATPPRLGRELEGRAERHFLSFLPPPGKQKGRKRLVLPKSLSLKSRKPARLRAVLVPSCGPGQGGPVCVRTSLGFSEPQRRPQPVPGWCRTVLAVGNLSYLYGRD